MRVAGSLFSHISVISLLSIGFVVVTAGCPREPPAPTIAPPPQPASAAPEPGVNVLDEERRCSSDAECTLTTVDCCGCDALGKQTGVRKDRLAALTERRRPICSVVSCAQAISDDPSCTATKAVCRDGMCVPDSIAGDNGAKKPAGVGVEPIR